MTQEVASIVIDVVKLDLMSVQLLIRIKRISRYNGVISILLDLLVLLYFITIIEVFICIISIRRIKDCYMKLIELNRVNFIHNGNTKEMCKEYGRSCLNC